MMIPEVGSRQNENPEPIFMHAFRGKCRYCHAIVLMPRDKNMALRPDHCWCVYCCQFYFDESAKDNLAAYEKRQWTEKYEKEGDSRL